MKVYVVTAGCYSDYHIEKIFTDRDQAQMYANLDDDRSVEEYPVVDDILLEESSRLRLNVVYDFKENKIISMTQINSEYAEYDPHISDDYYTLFKFSVLVTGKLLRDIAQKGMQSEMLLKNAQDKFYAEVDRLETTKRSLLERKQKIKEEYDRRFNRFAMYSTSSAMENPFEAVATQEVKNKLDELYKNGEPLPDVLTLVKMIRESRKKEETEGEKNG